jgi:hypothetical protein
MRRRRDEPSQIRIQTGDELGDYAFHEFSDEEEWFLDQAPDGHTCWEALPLSHPLSALELRRAQAPLPPPLPVSLKTRLLERKGVRAMLVGMVGIAGVGLVSLGIGSTRAAEIPVVPGALAVPSPAATAPAPAPTATPAPAPRIIAPEPMVFSSKVAPKPPAKPNRSRAHSRARPRVARR